MERRGPAIVPAGHRPVDRGHRREGSGAHREGPAYRSAGAVAAAGRTPARRQGRAVSHRPRRDRASQRPGLSEEARDTLLDAAIPALRRLLVNEPGLVRVRLELARAFFLKGEDTLATRHFEQVLAGKPPAPVVLNVNRFLAQMRARKRWSVRVGVALAPDGNVGASSRERTILIDTPLGRLPFTLNEDNAPKSGIGLSVWAGGEYQYPLEDRWRLRAGADISRREYRSDEFDQMTVSGHVGPRWLIGRASEASLLASVRQHCASRTRRSFATSGSGVRLHKGT